jgi:5-methylthioadenosine/S-adenosylhomocysteine deaminase
MKTASLLQKARLLDPLVMNAETVLEMATINAAKAIGQQNDLGSIEVNKKADVILIAMNKPHLTPVFNPVSHLIYAAEGTDVETVIINGEVVMENRNLKTLEEEEVLKEANERGQKLLERADLKIEPKWAVS